MSRYAPSPSSPNADGWCPGDVRVLKRYEQDLIGKTKVSEVYWPWNYLPAMHGKIGYTKVVKMECPTTGARRTLKKDYYFTESHDVRDSSVLRMYYEEPSIEESIKDLEKLAGNKEL